MSYRSQIRANQLRKARMYGGDYGGFTDEEGRSWLQQQVAENPNFIKESDQSQWSRDAFYHWKDEHERQQGRQPQGLPNVNDLPMPGVRVAPSQMPQQYQTGDYGLTVKTPQVNFKMVSRGPQMPQAPTVTADQVQKGQAAWGDMSVADRQKILKDPKFYESGAITKFSPQVQQEILQDQNFNWDQLPKWQKTYYDLSSSPAGMGAAQGALMGAIGGPGGALAGGAAGVALGWAAGKSGYDQTKEAWEQGNNKFTWDMNQLKEISKGAFGWMNFAAEQAEKGIGLGVKIGGILTGNDPTFDPNKRNLDVRFNKDFNLKPGDDFDANLLTGSTWDAGAGTFEAMSPAAYEALRRTNTIQQAKQMLGLDEEFNRLSDAEKAQRMSDPLGVQSFVEMFTDPEKYKGVEYYLGAANATEVQQTFYEKMAEAEKKIQAGGDYRQVMTDMQTGILAQVGDMVGQAVADPLNLTGKVQTETGKAISKITGNKIAEAAFTGTEGFSEAKAKYKTLVQTGEAVKIDPTFRADNMGGLSRWIAGVTKTGEIKAGGFTGAGFLDKVGGEAEARPNLFKDPAGFVKMLTSETPQSRAETGAVLFKDNVSAMLTMFKDPAEAVKYLKALANNDMETWAELGGRFAESPEFYTVLPALKAFNAEKLDGIITAWEMGAVNRDYLAKIAGALGDTQARILDDFAKRGTTQQDFARLQERLRASTDPQAKSLLGEIEAGRFTENTLKQVVDIFSGDGALPWHEGQWKAMMGAELSDHFANWAADRLALDKSPEAKSAFFRTMGLMKTAQSILLLGGSPGYAIQNGLSGMVHLAASGIYGYMTPGQIDNFLTKMGVSPERMGEGVGIGGIVEKGGADAITKAVKGTGPLTEAKQKLGRLSSGMPMSKLSSWFEKLNGKQAFAQGMKKFWSQSWRRGTGFSKMPKELAAEFTRMGFSEGHIYSLIEGAMNMDDIERMIQGRGMELKARSLVNDAARMAGQTPAQAAAMLEQLGVLDELDSYLQGAGSKEAVDAAFAKVRKVAREQMAVKRGQEIANIADQTAQTVGLEGAASALGIMQQVHTEFTDTWHSHYDLFNDVFEKLQDIPDEKMRNKAFEEAYRQSDEEFAGMWDRYAANYKGVFEAWKESGDPNAMSMLEGIAEKQQAMKSAYDQMRAMRKDHFETNWEGDLTKMFDHWDEISGRIDRLFDDAFKKQRTANEKQGAGLAAVFEKRYGTAAGEAARQWWESVTKFSDEMAAREKKVRSEIKAMPNKEERALAKKKWYQEDKRYQIAELERINAEGIAKLEKVIRGGGSDQGIGNSGTPTPPTEGSPSTSPTGTMTLRTELEEQAARRASIAETEAKARRAAVWDVAEGYWGKGANFSRGMFQDQFLLLSKLKDETLGGIADLKGLDDPRLDAATVKRVLDADAKIREAQVESQKATEAAITRKGTGPRIGENTPILQAIKELGGIKRAQAKDITGDVKGNMIGLFTNNGMDVSDIAIRLVEYGYPIDLNNPADIGGVAQVTDMIQKARAGNKTYPVGHDYDSANVKAEAEWIEQQLEDGVPDPMPLDEWNGEDWIDRVNMAAAADDVDSVMEMFGEIPSSRMDEKIPGTNDTYAEFHGETLRATAERHDQARQVESIAQAAVEADETITQAQVRGEAVSGRTRLQEQITEAFNLDGKQTESWINVSDAVSRWFKRKTGLSEDEFYSRYYKSIERKDAGDYLAEQGLEQTIDATEIKGATMRYGDGLQSMIYAFNRADMTTLVHENGHIFRKVLADVAQFTDDPKVRADLATIEEWAGAKDGVWTEEAEEKFARGFERYMADEGVKSFDLVNAGLMQAFETIRDLMLSVYEAITGSDIDVEVSEDVRRVFARMLDTKLDADATDAMRQRIYEGLSPDFETNIQKAKAGELEYRAKPQDGGDITTGDVTETEFFKRLEANKDKFKAARERRAGMGAAQERLQARKEAISRELKEARAEAARRAKQDPEMNWLTSSNLMKRTAYHNPSARAEAYGGPDMPRAMGEWTLKDAEYRRNNPNAAPVNQFELAENERMAGRIQDLEEKQAAREAGYLDELGTGRSRTAYDLEQLKAMRPERATPPQLESAIGEGSTGMLAGFEQPMSAGENVRAMREQELPAELADKKPWEMTAAQWDEARANDLQARVQEAKPESAEWLTATIEKQKADIRLMEMDLEDLRGLDTLDQRAKEKQIATREKKLNQLRGKDYAGNVRDLIARGQLTYEQGVEFGYNTAARAGMSDYVVNVAARVPFENWQGEFSKWHGSQDAAAIHREQVGNAMRDGKPTYEGAELDYPDLAEMYGLTEPKPAVNEYPPEVQTLAKEYTPKELEAKKKRLQGEDFAEERASVEDALDLQETHPDLTEPTPEQAKKLDAGEPVRDFEMTEAEYLRARVETLEQALSNVSNEIGYEGLSPRNLNDANKIVFENTRRSNELQKITNKMVTDFTKRGMSLEDAWVKVEQTPEWKEFTAEKPDVNKFGGAVLAYEKRQAQFVADYKRIVSEAIASGEKVPVEVVRQYPEFEAAQKGKARAEYGKAKKKQKAAVNAGVKELTAAAEKGNAQKRQKLTDVHMSETFNYGGEVMTRFEIMKDLEAKGGSREQIDMYMAGLERQKAGQGLDTPQSARLLDQQATVEAAGLQDFGEKLGGARKDLAAKAKEDLVKVIGLDDAALASMKLSEIFPKSMIDNIEDVGLAAFAKTVRDAIPSKPRDSWKLKRWVGQVKELQGLIRTVTEIGLDAALEKTKAFYSLKESFTPKVNILRDVPREKWGRLGEARYYPDAMTYKDGQKTPAPWGRAEVDGKPVNVNGDFETFKAAVLEKLGGQKVKPEAVMSFQVRRNSGTGEVFINKEGDPLYRKLKTFASQEEAFAFIKDNHADLVQAWEDVKNSDNVKETDVRGEENAPRAGKDYRQGMDATPQMFLESFGFRGVEFGNWVSQGKNLKERQGMLNAAYDALRDLADIAGVPPRAISLNGTLGLGLGSRGSGAASAHYEPGNIVINLTKTRGAGTLAHEWFHALDNYFSRKRGVKEFTGSQDAYREGNYITYKPEPLMVYKDGRMKMTESELRRRQELHPNSSLYRMEDWKTDPDHPQGVRPEVEKRFAALVEALDKSPMTERAKLIDKGKGSEGYWSRVIERAARSFENYIIAKMAQSGFQNDYLANVKKLEQFKRDPGRYPYLLDEELPPIREAFDALLGEMKVEEKTGALYQRAKRVTSNETPSTGLLPWFEQAMSAGEQGVLIGMQEGAGGALRKMEMPTGARSLYDVDEARVISDKAGAVLKRGDMVKGADGRQHTVKGANLRGKLLTEDGRILDPASVQRVAKQETLFQRADATNTPAFKKWFGGSKVVEENGKPLVVYHGTNANFQEFDFGKLGRSSVGGTGTDFGFFFGADETHSQYWAKNAVNNYGGDETVMPVYLRIEKPAYIDATEMDGGDTLYAGLKDAYEGDHDGAIVQVRGDDETLDVKTMYVVFAKEYDVEPIKSVNNFGTFDGDNPNILYQRARRDEAAASLPGEQPVGSMEAAAGFEGAPKSAFEEEGWRDQVMPLLDAMQETARERVSTGSTNDGMRDMSPEGQKMLRQYMRQVQTEMATTKRAAMKWGENKRDEALLNYGKRYGIDRYFEVGYPYGFFMTRSMMGWAARALDKPAWFANYARLKRQQERYERDIPERMRGKIRIEAPWMPDWMGDALYIDPMGMLFTPENFLRPFERMQQDATQQEQEAMRILQEWASDGTTSEAEIQKAMSREGTTWERAMAEAGMRREAEVSSPLDFMNSMFGLNWALSTPYKLATGQGKDVTSTPLLNTTRAVDTVTQGTWAEGIGNLVGMIGKPEEMLRKKLGLPEFGEYGDYYVDRQLANMAAEGLISAEDAQLAMIERQGETFDQARERVKMEMAMRVPTMSAMLAGLTADNFAQGIGRVATTMPASLFGAGLLPEGELKYRGLKDEWDEAWKKRDAGDSQAIADFFDEHPEYQAYLAKGKEPEERMRSFLVGQIWDGYMELGETNQRAARAQMGDEFNDSFLNKETRSYESIPVETLVEWARLFGKKTPAPLPSASPQMATESASQFGGKGLDLYGPEVTQLTDKYFSDRRQKFPNYYEQEQGYYNLPKSERAKYLSANPQLREYWNWKDSWSETHPELVPIFKGQVFKTVDTSAWSPYLVEYVADYAMTGRKLPNGAWKALEQQWIMEGQPYGDMKTWLNSQVVPAMMYGQ